MLPWICSAVIGQVRSAVLVAGLGERCGHGDGACVLHVVVLSLECVEYTHLHNEDRLNTHNVLSMLQNVLRVSVYVANKWVQSKCLTFDGSICFNTLTHGPLLQKKVNGFNKCMTRYLKRPAIYWKRLNVKNVSKQGVEVELGSWTWRTWQPKSRIIGLINDIIDAITIANPWSMRFICKNRHDVILYSSNPPSTIKLLPETRKWGKIKMAPSRRYASLPPKIRLDTQHIFNNLSNTNT